MAESQIRHRRDDKDRIIEVRGLFSVLNEEVVLSDVTFHANRGEVTIILGGSGSGKTTVMKHLLGLHPSMDDAVSVLGTNPSMLGESEEKIFYSKIGVVYQQGALLNSMTVGENVGLPLEQHTGLPGGLIEEIVRWKLKLVRLEEAYDKLPSELSGGMLKRAAIARAIVMDPLLLFCDEPGAGLDPVSLSQLDALILELKEQLGMTVILVTHEVSSILRMADRIVFLDRGSSIFHGTLESALSSPLDPLREFFTTGRAEKTG